MYQPKKGVPWRECNESENVQFSQFFYFEKVSPTVLPTDFKICTYVQRHFPDFKLHCIGKDQRFCHVGDFQKLQELKKLATLVSHHDNSKRKHSFFEGKIRIKDGIPMINYRQPLASYSAPPFILRKIFMKLLLCGRFFFFSFPKAYWIMVLVMIYWVQK